MADYANLEINADSKEINYFQSEERKLPVPEIHKNIRRSRPNAYGMIRKPLHAWTGCMKGE